MSRSRCASSRWASSSMLCRLKLRLPPMPMSSMPIRSCTQPTGEVRTEWTSIRQMAPTAVRACMRMPSWRGLHLRLRSTKRMVASSEESDIPNQRGADFAESHPYSCIVNSPSVASKAVQPTKTRNELKLTRVAKRMPSVDWLEDPRPVEKKLGGGCWGYVASGGNVVAMSMSCAAESAATSHPAPSAATQSLTTAAPIADPIRGPISVPKTVAPFSAAIACGLLDCSTAAPTHESEIANELDDSPCSAREVYSSLSAVVHHGSKHAFLGAPVPHCGAAGVATSSHAATCSTPESVRSPRARQSQARVVT
mmetsp:Transcript_62818/g.139872  ORF Transcript_62818/g.139872 Transcript_62818/m.139872 type:complete len:310 (-) Transcript_62818:252-1181(-)